MKKILTLVLCMGMLFTAAACSSKKVDDKAISKLGTVLANMEKMKSLDYNAVLNFTNGTEKADLTMYGQFNGEKEKPEVSFNVDVNADGETMKNYIGLFLKDDYIYFNMLGIMKQKSAINNVKEQEQIPDLSAVDKEAYTFDKEDFKKASIKGDVLSLQFDSSELNQAIPMLYRPMISFSAMDMDITLTEDDMISGIKMKMTITVKDSDGKSSTLNVTFNIDLKDVNAVKEVTFPDLSEYVEGSDGNSDFMDMLNSLQNQ